MVKKRPLVGVDLRYFKLTGLWQLVTNRRRPLAVILDAMAGLLFVCHVFYQLTDTVRSGYEFSIFTEKLAVNLTMIESAIKMTYYHHRRESLHILTKCFQKDLLTGSRRAGDVLERGTRSANSIFRSFLVVLFSTVTVWNSVPILKCLWLSTCTDWCILPTFYPFDAGHFPGALLIYAFEFFLMVYCAHLLANVNCLFAAIAFCLSAQFDVLAANLSGLRQYRQRDCISDALLRDCLRDHQKLLKMTNLMEDMFNPMFLFQMLASTVTICLVLVQINVQSASEDIPEAVIFKFLMYLMFGLVELFLYSWACQTIQDKSDNVRWALYDSGWVGKSAWFRKCILIGIVRSSKSEALTAGKFYTINLVAFTQVVKASYSYFTFLHGSQSKNLVKSNRMQ